MNSIFLKRMLRTQLWHMGWTRHEGSLKALLVAGVSGPPPGGSGIHKKGCAQVTACRQVLTCTRRQDRGTVNRFPV
jgi:hypothetical protein